MSTAQEQPRIVLVTLDHENGAVTITRSDKKEDRFPLDLTAGRPGALARVYYVPGRDGLLARTRAGEDLFLELPRRAAEDELAGRPVVYLDQNKWSEVANAREDPSRVRHPDDRDAALLLAHWADTKRLVLPASGGHHFETTKWGDAARRRRLGLTVVGLSRGWQMRDPVSVRRDEFHDMFRHLTAGGTGLRHSPVFTLAPDVLHGAWRGGPGWEPAEDLPPDDALLLRALVNATVTIEVLLDPDRVEPGADRGWAAVNQDFGARLAGTGLDAQQKRRQIDGALFREFGLEIAEEAEAAGATPRQLDEWLRQEGAGGLSDLPSAGMYREIFHERHLNPGTKWGLNDLMDMVYLACAAAYADVVVCEGATHHNLTRGIGRLGRGAWVFRRLRDAVPAVEAVLAPKP